MPIYTKNDFLIENGLKTDRPCIIGVFICAHQIRLVPWKGKNICNHNFNISVYYLQEEEINAIEKAGKKR